MNILIKSYLIFAVISLTVFIAIFKFTEYLDNKPKSNKLRQWWSRHIVDLDNLYHE